MDAPRDSSYAHVAKPDLEARHQQVLTEGAKAVGVAVPLMGVAHFLAQRNVEFYRRVSVPGKVNVKKLRFVSTFLMLMIPTMTFFTVTDRASIRWARENSQRFSVSGPSDLLGPSASGTAAGWKDTVNRHRYQIIGYGWAGTMAATLLYNYRRTDITRSLKIINARMTAQLFALVGVAAIAGLAATAPAPASIDPHFDRVVNGNTSRYYPK
ncbi:hypothetical protein HKX48_000475 [Thoreauomyces humboldtii]|nr:hypothetical protein HKX48_000475 [Thoreauomyces humboldtii]